MANEKNLVPMNKRTKSEQREIARKGGKSSGESRQEKKAMREVLLELLKLPLKDCGLENFSSIQDIKGKNITAMQAVLVGQMKKAMGGDTQAAIFVRDTSGSKPKETTISELNLGGNVQFNSGGLKETLAELRKRE